MQVKLAEYSAQNPSGTSTPPQTASLKGTHVCYSSFTGTCMLSLQHVLPGGDKIPNQCWNFSLRVLVGQCQPTKLCL